MYYSFGITEVTRLSLLNSYNIVKVLIDIGRVNKENNNDLTSYQIVFF